MELSYAQCETILNTLPIGYYANRRVATSLDAKAETSFYTPMEDTIVVSYPAIAERMKKVVEGADIEEAVRSMLYHEVSHAILTNGEYMRATPINNIFEDERIETILKDYYMNTNFKKQLYELCGGIPTATTNEEAFFNAVRFRCAPEEILKDINSIIRDYSDLSRTLGSWYEWRDYAQAIENLYRKIAKEFKANPNAFQPPEGQEGSGSQQNPDELKQGQGKGQKKEQGNGQASGEQSNQENGEGAGDNGNDSQENEGEGEGKKSYVAIETESPLTQAQIKKMVGASLAKHPPLSDKKQKQLDDFTKTAETIISNFNKKNNGGSGVNAYSGVFNPRAVVRQDYRFFERSMTTQGNNKFGTCHLNLFIDASGSMGGNEDIINGMLASLSEIERKNRNFTMDVSFIDHEYHDCKTVRERQYTATGGNTIPVDMKQRFLKRQLPNTCNYNIVLFDGDAICNERMTDEEAIRRFGAFDYKQTTLITDPDNEQYLGKGFHATKVVVTENYTEELLSHITKALTVAFG